jgi:ferredoxin
MLLTRFIPCVACKRVVRVFDSRLRQTARSEVQLPDDGATSAEDGTFECPFCGRVQRPEPE